MVIICSDTANKQIDEIYTNKHIYDKYGHFTQKFINWNYEFHRYVNKTSIEQVHLSQKVYTKSVQLEHYLINATLFTIPMYLR